MPHAEPPRCVAAKLLSPHQVTADLCLRRRHSKGRSGSVSTWVWSLWVFMHTRVFFFFFWALQASLAGMGFVSKHDFAPPSILLRILLYLWTWDVLFCESNNLSMVVQQPVAILEFSQKKINTHPSTLPSLCTNFLAGSYDSSIFSFLWNFYTVLLE